MNNLELLLEKADKSHIEEICNLVNLAYRGNDGWTKETGLIHGNRSNELEINNYITNADAHLLIAKNSKEIFACVCIEKNEDNVYIGLLAVKPNVQGKGIGKEILLQAENYALHTLKSNRYIVVVVSQRKELIEFYQRRGYVKTGVIKEYPVQLNVGVPIKKLTIEHLEKNSYKAL